MPEDVSPLSISAMGSSCERFRGLMACGCMARFLWYICVSVYKRHTFYCRSVRTFARTKYVTLALPSEAQHGADIRQLPVVIAPARS
jgi:hypothetical protein